jgi:hypothetical protein
MFEVSRRGPEAVVRAASRLRQECAPEDGDALASDLIGLLEEREVEPHLAPLLAAAPVFAGPRAIARAGRVLRSELQDEQWKVEPAMAVLAQARTAEAAIQLLLCSREASDLEVLDEASTACRRSQFSPGEVHAAARAETPAGDLERYLSYTLESALRARMRFLGANLERTLHTAAHRHLHRVIWVRYDGGSIADAFMIDPEEPRFMDAEYESVRLPSACLIGVAHPAELSAEQRDAFGMVLADHELTGLFPQLDRAVADSDDEAEYRQIDRHVMEAEFRPFMARNGWAYGARGETFVLQVRGSELHLTTDRVGQGDRILRSFSLTGPRIARRHEDEIIHGEAHVAMARVMERFAPGLI